MNNTSEEPVEENLKGFTVNNDGTVVLYYEDRRYSGLLEEEV